MYNDTSIMYNKVVIIIIDQSSQYHIEQTLPRPTNHVTGLIKFYAHTSLAYAAQKKP